MERRGRWTGGRRRREGRGRRGRAEGETERRERKEGKEQDASGDWEQVHLYRP